MKCYSLINVRSTPASNSNSQNTPLPTNMDSTDYNSQLRTPGTCSVSRVLITHSCCQSHIHTPPFKKKLHSQGLCKVMLSVPTWLTKLLIFVLLSSFFFNSFCSLVLVFWIILLCVVCLSPSDHAFASHFCFNCICSWLNLCDRLLCHHTMNAAEESEFQQAITAHGQLLGEHQQRLADLNNNLNLLSPVPASTVPGAPAPQAPITTFRAPISMPEKFAFWQVLSPDVITEMACHDEALTFDRPSHLSGPPASQSQQLSRGKEPSGNDHPFWTYAAWAHQDQWRRKRGDAMNTDASTEAVLTTSLDAVLWTPNP